MKTSIGKFFTTVWDGCYLVRRIRQSVASILLSNASAEFASFGTIAIGSAVLGSEVFSAWGQVLPLKLALTASTRIFLDAMLILVPRAYGMGDRERADRLLGTAILATAAVILASGVLTVAGRGAFLSACAGSDTIRTAAATYYDWTFFIVATGSIRLALERLVLSEGRTNVVWIASVVFMAVDLIILAALARPLGVTGLCIAETLAPTVAALVLIGALLRSKTSFRLCFAVSLDDVVTLAKAGLPKVVARIGDALIIFYGNQLLAPLIGAASLACAHFAKSARKFLMFVPDALDSASAPIVCAMLGERNWRGLRRTLMGVCSTSIVSGILITVVVFFSADFIAGLCGFGGVQREQAALGLRCATLLLALYFRKDLVASYHNNLGRIWISSLVRFLTRGYATMFFGLLLMKYFGGGVETFFYGVVLADAALFVISLAGSAVGRPPGTTWAFNLPVGELARQAYFNFTFTARDIVALAEKVAAGVRKMGGSPALAMRARLLAEETQTRRLEKIGARRELGECLLTVAEDRRSATVQFRDTLKLGEDAPGTARPDRPDYCALVLLEAVVESHVYTPVIGSNRTVYTVTD